MNTEVFSINFIRQEFLPSRIRRAAIFIGLGYLLMNLLVAVVFLGMAFFSSLQCRLIQNRLHAVPAAGGLQTLDQGMKTIREQFAKSQNQLSAILTLKKQVFPVAGNLAVLAETLPARAWINSLSADHNKRILKIQAAYLIDPGKPYDFPVKGWVEALKAHPHFSAGLKRLELGASSRTAQGTAKLFLFELLAEWEPLGGVRR